MICFNFLLLNMLDILLAVVRLDMLSIKNSVSVSNSEISSILYLSTKSLLIKDVYTFLYMH